MKIVPKELELIIYKFAKIPCFVCNKKKIKIRTYYDSTINEKIDICYQCHRKEICIRK